MTIYRLCLGALQTHVLWRRHKHIIVPPPKAPVIINHPAQIFIATTCLRIVGIFLNTTLNFEPFVHSGGQRGDVWKYRHCRLQRDGDLLVFPSRWCICRYLFARKIPVNAHWFHRPVTVERAESEQMWLRLALTNFLAFCIIIIHTVNKVSNTTSGTTDIIIRLFNFHAVNQNHQDQIELSRHVTFCTYNVIHKSRERVNNSNYRMLND